MGKKTKGWMMKNILGVKVYGLNGKLIKVRARCELCKFAQPANIDKEYESIIEMVQDDDFLVCRFDKKLDVIVDDKHCCDSFQFDNNVLSDIRNGCIS